MSLLDEWTRQNEELALKLEVLEGVAEVLLGMARNEKWFPPRE